jgi:hypothetical protein
LYRSVVAEDEALQAKMRDLDRIQTCLEIWSLTFVAPQSQANDLLIMPADRNFRS